MIEALSLFMLIVVVGGTLVLIGDALSERKERIKARKGGTHGFHR